MAETIEILLIGGPRDGDIVVMKREDNVYRHNETRVSSNRSSKVTASLSMDYRKREITIEGKRYAYGFCDKIEEYEAESRIRSSSLKPIQ